MHQPPVRFTYRLLSYLISTIIAGQPLLPAVGAVITPQNGAGMDKAANGVPVVNIATPNGAGISHNRFTDYNVGKEGLILNNATGKLNPTQLGGLIQNNPNLKAGGEAKGIINEVTGGNRSLLQGYTEVAGKAANVMVANPYGITCDGCGFINTPHATLTTGKPVMNADGSLQALEVTEGSITINGAGLDGTWSDAVSIIARATEVNAALHAKDLTVTAGANRITADGRVSALKGEGNVPKVAVDTGALGGMYARRIHLTSTESGVGVNLGNLYAREGDIILSSSGKLVLKNSLAGGSTTVTGTDVSLSGDNKAGGNLSVTGTTGLTLNQSRLVTDKHDRREAGTTQSQSASTIGSTAGNVSITAGKQAHISGSDVIANRDISITGDSVVVDPGHDRRTVDEKFEQKKSGLTVALSGTVGSAINNAVTSAQETKESSDSRLKALQATKTALSGVQAGQAAAMATATGDPNATGVSLSLTTQKSKSQQHSESDTVSGSTLNAGNNLSVVATGKNRGDNRGDIVIAGSQLKAGGNTSLDAANDILLSGAANTQKTTGRNSSSGGGVGVSIGAGKGAGISVFASVNAAKGSEKGNGTEWTETTTDSGKTVTINSGRDTVLNGAQVNGNRIIADVGHDLQISSQQDTSKYDSKQTSVAAGGSFTFGSMTGSGYIAASRDKMKSRFDSVAEQTGMFAGDGGFDITVGRHTQLDGAVIASTATPDKNHLDTGTLGFSDLHNEADYKVSHSGISLSGGGSFGDKFQGNMPGGMISAGGHSGHAEGTTQAAVAEGTITIRDRDNQKQNPADLSRDPAHANDSISPIFDKEKEQRRLQTVGLISDIGSQVADIARTQGELNALKAAKEATGETLPANATEKQRQEYLAKLRDTPEYKKEQEKYGTGSEIQLGIQAATAALQGLAGGNLAGALAGASAPELAHLLKSTEKDPAVNAIAHAILGGAVAAMQGNNVAAGAAGAATGELAARAIAGMLYPGVKQSDLSEEQKQTISTLATVSAGLAGGLTGNSTASAAVGAQSGKNAVENNALSLPPGMVSYGQAVASWNQYADANNLTPEQKQAGLDKLAKGELPDGANISKVIVDGYKDGVLIAGAWYLGPAVSVGKAVVGGVTSAAVNGGFQWYGLSQPGSENQSWDYKGSASSFMTGMLAPGRTVTANTAIALGGSVFSDGANIKSQSGTALGAYAGGYVGEYFPVILRPALGNSASAVGDIGGGFVSELINYGIKNYPTPTNKEPEHE
nr:filamentous hemagglutinin N-terminal domain-containing protein [Escherichia coli]